MDHMNKGRETQRGQIIVMMAGAMVAVILVVALIVDGGNAWAQRRIVQNGSDAMAQAGAIVMAQRFAGVPAPGGGWDAEVNAKIQASAAANNVANAVAYYTDICGIPLKADGTAALHGDGTEDLASAVQVGSGALPGGTATTPDCPTAHVGPVAGVMVTGTKNFKTYLTGVIGMTNLDASARATAVTGYLQGNCTAAQGNGVRAAAGHDPGQHRRRATAATTRSTQAFRGSSVRSTRSRSARTAGNVGWIDWTPPGGGTSELIGSIQTPNNPAIDLPSWQYVTETGNVNSAGVETALRAYDGQVVLIPQFDQTCGPGPHGTPDSSKPAINTPPNYGCPAGALGGNGNNQWYRFPSFAYFQMCSNADADCVNLGVPHGAYVNGNNRSECDTGNGATSCLAGRFVEILGSGTVGPGVGGGTTGTKAIGIQLIQ